MTLRKLFGDIGGVFKVITYEGHQPMLIALARAYYVMSLQDMSYQRELDFLINHLDVDPKAVADDNRLAMLLKQCEPIPNNVIPLPQRDDPIIATAVR